VTESTEEVLVLDPLSYYDPENSIFPNLQETFAKTGKLDPLAFYVVLDWKSSRARTRHLWRLAAIGGSFEAAVCDIAVMLAAAPSPEQRLGELLTRWKFQLPTATAILSVLYPEEFTIYDVRVCDALGRFHELDGKRWSSEIWLQYRKFVEAVKSEAPSNLSLRDCDRWLWGKDKQRVLQGELEGACEAIKPSGTYVEKH
jgi:hypothetical protein